MSKKKKSCLIKKKNKNKNVTLRTAHKIKRKNYLKKKSRHCSWKVKIIIKKKNNTLKGANAIKASRRKKKEKNIYIIGRN